MTDPVLGPEFPKRRKQREIVWEHFSYTVDAMRADNGNIAVLRGIII